VDNDDDYDGDNNNNNNEINFLFNNVLSQQLIGQYQKQHNLQAQ